MTQIEKLLTTIFGGILAIAIISVIVGRKSQAPAAIQAFSSGLANVVAAAVNPANTASTNGNNGAATFTTPANTSAGKALGALGITIPNFGGM